MVHAYPLGPVSDQKRDRFPSSGHSKSLGGIDIHYLPHCQSIFVYKCAQMCHYDNHTVKLKGFKWLINILENVIR